MPLDLPPPPPAAFEYLPVLSEEVQARWPGMKRPEVLAAQVHKETCITERHRYCWNPRAELKTAREYGFGLGQLTVTAAFDNFKAAQGWDASLKGWRWERRFDPRMQLRALVVYDRNLHRSVTWAGSEDDRLAMALSAYNGGLGGLLKDRRLCAATEGCDPARWWGHVELRSFRAKTAVQGYGQSFFEINRGYVRRIMRELAPRYEGAMW